MYFCEAMEALALFTTINVVRRRPAPSPPRARLLPDRPSSSRLAQTLLRVCKLQVDHIARLAVSGRELALLALTLARLTVVLLMAGVPVDAQALGQPLILILFGIYALLLVPSGGLIGALIRRAARGQGLAARRPGRPSVVAAIAAGRAVELELRQEEGGADDGEDGGAAPAAAFSAAAAAAAGGEAGGGAAGDELPPGEAAAEDGAATAAAAAAGDDEPVALLAEGIVVGGGDAPPRGSIRADSLVA